MPSTLPKDYDDLIKKLAEDFFLIKQSRLWFTIGGVFAFVLAASGVTIAAVFITLYSWSAAQAAERIEGYEASAKTDADSIAEYLETAKSTPLLQLGTFEYSSNESVPLIQDDIKFKNDFPSDNVKVVAVLNGLVYHEQPDSILFCTTSDIDKSGFRLRITTEIKNEHPSATRVRRVEGFWIAVEASSGLYSDHTNRRR